MNLGVMDRRRGFTALLTTSVVAASLAIAGPARAESTVVRDGADATASLTDIRKVRVNHRAQDLVVKMRFTDLRPKSEAGSSSIAIFLDINKQRKGPEFGVLSGLQNGTDYSLLRMKKWKPVGDPLTCPHELDLQFAKDRLVLKVSRDCLREVPRVRVGAKMTDEYDGSHPVVDWLEGPRNWTTWLASG